MLDNNNPIKKTKKPRNVKRIVNFCGPVMCAPNTVKLCVKYIVDHGNLISDIRAVHTEVVSFPDYEAMNIQVQKYIQSRQRVKHDLEHQIYATGATRYNAEFTAQKLWDQYVMQRGC